MDNNGQIKTEVLTLAETAGYLKLSEKTVHRMIGKQAIPCSRVGGQWRFIKSVLDDWLQARMQVIPGNDLGRLLQQDEDLVPLSRLLQPELINLDLKEGNKREILFQLVQILVRVGKLDSVEPFLSKLLEREEMASTAIGGGIAIPHLRKPGENLLRGPHIIAGLCRRGVDFAAFDRKPTYLFFLLITESEVVHLKVMSRLSALLKEQEFRQSLQGALRAEEFLGLILRREASLKNNNFSVLKEI